MTRAPAPPSAGLPATGLAVRAQPDEADLLAAALRALDGPAATAAGDTLAALFEHRRQRNLSRVLDEWSAPKDSNDK